MRNIIFTLSLSILVLAPLGCVGGTTSCDFRDGSVNGPEPRCQERSGLQGGATFKATCEGLGAEGIDGSCPADGIVLGCEIGPDVVDWYYAPRTEDEIKADCADEGGTIVNP